MKPATIFAIPLGLCLGTAVCSHIASAATVEPGPGIVMVNLGQGFKPIAKPTTVPPGATVMVSGGETRITYNKGCVVLVQPGAVVSVVPDDQCTPQVSPPDTSFVPLAIVGGVVVAAAVIGSSGSDSSSSTPASSPTPTQTQPSLPISTAGAASP